MYKFFTERPVWAWGGLLVILSSLWGMTQITVQISHWRRNFFDMVQKMLDGEGDPSQNLNDLFAGMWEFGYWAAIFVGVAVIVDYLTQRWLLSWRESVMWYYHQYWPDLRGTEGASQRLQEDTKLYTRLLETIGEGAVSAIMTLIAFTPILWDISKEVPELLFLNIEGGVMWNAIWFAAAGTAFLIWLGRSLPGLEYNNQVAEAALRKELVIGEDDSARAWRADVNPLWASVHKNYCTLFFHYMKFGLGKHSYLQFGVLFPLIMISPSIAAGLISWGLLMQLLDAFGRVESSMQFLLRSWTLFVEYFSVRKRLIEFEAKIS